MSGELQGQLDQAYQLHAAGQAAQAEAIYRQILIHHPDCTGALNGLGILYAQQGKHDVGIALLRQADAVARSSGDRGMMLQVNANLGLIYQEIGKIDQAIAACRAAIDIDPHHFGAYNNLGLALAAQDKFEESIEQYEQSLRLRPDNAHALNNLGNAHLELLQTRRAMECYDRAIYFDPAFADAHWNRSLLRLLLGDLHNGWQEYQWRWVRFPEQRRHFTQPMWDGFDIAGKTILLHAEQGLGDAIQFVRYAPIVAERGATVIVECHRPLVPLMQTVAGVSRVVVRGEALPDFDVHCPLLNVPYAAGTNSIASIPAATSYVHADPALVATWGERVKRHAPDGKRIGLAWAGSKRHHEDRHRSTSLDTLKPLLEVPGVRFFSLQVDRGEPHEPIIDLTVDIRDLADSAALVASLDLVITVDTAAAHLAGALGRPAWILLPYNPDWRWLLHREDTPWYPSARLFRQASRGGWAGVIGRVATELSRFER